MFFKIEFTISCWFIYYKSLSETVDSIAVLAASGTDADFVIVSRIWIIGDWGFISPSSGRGIVRITAGQGFDIIRVNYIDSLLLISFLFGESFVYIFILGFLMGSSCLQAIELPELLLVVFLDIIWLVISCSLFHEGFALLWGVTCIFSMEAKIKWGVFAQWVFVTFLAAVFTLLSLLGTFFVLSGVAV